MMFQRDDGATTGFSTQISILQPEAEPIGSGNACTADDDLATALIGNGEALGPKLRGCRLITSLYNIPTSRESSNTKTKSRTLPYSISRFRADGL